MFTPFLDRVWNSTRHNRSVYHGRSPSKWFPLIMHIPNRSHDRPWWRGGTTAVPHACTYHFFFLAVAWPYTRSTFDLRPSPGNFTGKTLSDQSSGFWNAIFHNCKTINFCTRITFVNFVNYTLLRNLVLANHFFILWWPAGSDLLKWSWVFMNKVKRNLRKLVVYENV